MELALWRLRSVMAALSPLRQGAFAALAVGTVWALRHYGWPALMFLAQYLMCIDTLLNTARVPPAAALPPDSPECDAAPPPFRTLFFPGHGADLSQLGRYLGPHGAQVGSAVEQLEGFPAPYHLRHSDAARLIYYPWRNIDDGAQPYGVRLLRKDEAYTWRWALAHAINWIRMLWTGVRGCAPTLWDWRSDNIGQTSDVTHALRFIRDVCSLRIGPLAPPQRLVLFGASRGASVALQAAAALTPAEAARVKLLVFEAGFDDSVTAARARFGVFTSLVLRLLEHFTEYRVAESRAPLHAAQSFPHKDMPILLVTSAVDTVVPRACVYAIEKALKDAGCTNVTLLELAHSPHSDYATADAEDRKSYAAALGAHYQRLVKVQKTA